MDLSALTDEELKALSQGDYTKLSDKALKSINDQRIAATGGDRVSSMTMGDLVSGNTPEQPQKRNVSYLAQLLGRYGNSLTAGLVNPVSAGISTVIGKGLQAAGVIPEKSTSDTYHQISTRQKERDRQWQDDNPIVAGATDIAGLVTPGGGFSQAGRIGQGVASALKLEQVGKTAKEIQIGKKVLEGLVRGGVTNTLYGQVNTDADTPLDERAVKGVLDFVIGGVPDAGISGTFAGGAKIADKLVEARIPQRLYAGAVGLGKEGAKHPEMIDTLIKEGAVGSKDKLQSLSAQKLKEIGAELRAKLTGKEANYDDIMSQISDFENKFASGERESASNALNKVMGEFKGLFKDKTDDAAMGVMQRPSYEEFKQVFLKKFGVPKADAYVQEESHATANQILNYIHKRDPLTNPSKKIGKTIIRRTAGGYPVKQSPFYSESRIEVPQVQLRVPEKLTPPQLHPSPERVVAQKSNIITKHIPNPTKDDLYRLYLQQFPEETISLAATPGKTSKMIDLADLNFEKSRLANSSRRLYENPDLNAQATKKAQQTVADASRRVIEDAAPEVSGLNQRYHAYDALHDAIEQTAIREASKPLTRVGLSDIGLGGASTAAAGPAAGVGAVALKRGLESTTAQTNIASFLYKLLNRAKDAQIKSVYPFAGVVDQAVRNYDNNSN